MLNKEYERLERILGKKESRQDARLWSLPLVFYGDFFGGCSVWLGLRLGCVRADLQVKVFHFQTIEQVEEVIRVVEVVVN